MLKEQAVASLGQSSLLMPAWIKSALAANDRLKLYLTLLQSAAQRASAPDKHTEGGWEAELARSLLHNAPWVQDMLQGAYFDDELLVLPHLDDLLRALSADLSTMARPVCDTGPDNAPPWPSAATPGCSACTPWPTTKACRAACWPN